jgi:hypothetical protein
MKLIPVTYVIHDGEFYKVGIAANLFDRITSMRSGNPRPLEVLYVYSGYMPERWYHELLAEYHYSGEWFKCDRHIIDTIHAGFSEEAIRIPEWRFDYFVRNQTINGKIPNPKALELRKSIQTVLKADEPKRKRKRKSKGGDPIFDDIVPF